METESTLESVLAELEESYPSITERIQALAFDGVIIFVSAFCIFSGLDSLGMENSELKAPIFILLFFLYDPLMIAFAGGTLGHKMLNLKVRKASDTSKKMNFIVAVVRFVFKTLLGWVSLLTITGNEKRQAIHDLVTNSVVLKIKKMR